jgi:transposase
MSLHPHIIAPVPEETARVARAAFPQGHPYLTLRDGLGTIFQDEDFAPLFPAWGYPGLPPWRLALVTIMQFRENLADRQAAEAVRAHRLEVSAESRADGPGLRLFGPERIPGPPASRER